MGWAGHLRWLLVVGLGLGLVTGASGQSPLATDETPLQLEPVVVTAGVVATPLSQTLSSVTVITRDQIEAQQTASVTDVLRQVPGLHIDQPGARGGISSVYLRGADPNFTVVLIDGVKVNDPTNTRGGSVDVSTLSTDNIERIEIVRGPLSAVYGSDAMAGAIHIITRRGDARPIREVDISGGRFGYVRTHLHARGLLGVMDYALSGSFLDNGEPVEGSQFISKTLQANLGVPLSATMDLRWMLRYADIDRETFPDDSGGPRFAVRRAVEERATQEWTLGIAVAHEPLPWWTSTLQVGIYNRQEDVDSPGVAPGRRDPVGIPPSVVENSLMRYELTLRHVVSVATGVRLGAGAHLQIENGSSRGRLDVGGFLVPTRFDLSRHIWAPFVEVEFSLLPGLRVQGGVRVDLPDGFDPEASPRVGVSYTLEATGTTLSATWGEGFKLPGFFSLGNPLVGNPLLVPETSRGVEAGVTQVLWKNRVTLQVTSFYNTFRHLIDFEEGPPPRLVNRSEVVTTGVEMSLHVQPWPWLGLTSHLTYVETDIKGTDEALRNRPRWRGGLTVHWRPRPGLGVNLQALVVGQALDSAIPTGDRELDAYARVDLAVTWALSETWQVFVSVDNLFDADSEEVVGFPAPGIAPRGGVQARF